MTLKSPFQFGELSLGIHVFILIIIIIIVIIIIQNGAHYKTRCLVFEVFGLSDSSKILLLLVLVLKDVIHVDTLS